jgi:preprotein translocase subunit SecD
MLLAACQNMTGKHGSAGPSTSSSATGAAAPSASAAAAPSAGAAGQTEQYAAQHGASVAVFLADTQQQKDWTPVKLADGTLYVNPRPVLTRADLTGIRAGANKEGTGLLALELNSSAKQKITDITTQNPNKRLVLVVGRTMMAAPGYSRPVTSQELVFAVGTEQNATAAARAIAGSDAGSQQAPAASPAPAPSAPSSSASKPR